MPALSDADYSSFLLRACRARARGAPVVVIGRPDRVPRPIRFPSHTPVPQVAVGRDVPPRDRALWLQRDGARVRRRCASPRPVSLPIRVPHANARPRSPDALGVLLEYYGAQDLQGACEFLSAVASVRLPPLAVPLFRSDSGANFKRFRHRTAAHTEKRCISRSRTLPRRRPRLRTPPHRNTLSARVPLPRRGEAPRGNQPRVRGSRCRNPLHEGAALPAVSCLMDVRSMQSGRVVGEPGVSWLIIVLSCCRRRL